MLALALAFLVSGCAGFRNKPIQAPTAGALIVGATSSMMAVAATSRDETTGADPFIISMAAVSVTSFITAGILHAVLDDGNEKEKAKELENDGVRKVSAANADE